MARSATFEPVYQAFQIFLQRCLLEDRSLLWPEREVWTIANLEQARRRFVEGFIQGRMDFRAKLAAQLSGAPRDVWALIADCFVIYGLPSRSIRPATKQNWAAWAAEQAGLPIPGDDNPIWQALTVGFATTGQKYNLKHAQIRLLVLMALEVKASQDPRELLQSPQRLQTLLDDVLETIPLKLDQANDMRNAILYMAFPEAYEPVLSRQEKEAIVRHYGGGTLEATSVDVDAALRQVRQALTPRFRSLPRPFDFYQDLREEWRAHVDLERALTGQNPPAHRLEEHSADYQSEDVDLQRVQAALEMTRNVILTGPPGTGKTYLARRAAERLVMGQGAPVDSFVWWVTLHPSYSYEDFVEGLRPVLAENQDSAPGGGVYQIRPGVFREICARAAADPQHRYVLILDEMNRANLATILGEIITLIEDDKRGVFHARLPYSGLPFSVPPNLILLGTMNSADRSITQLDAALRRRFAFIELHPRPDLLRGAWVETDEAVLHLDELLRGLNAVIQEHLGAELQIGHSYFLRVAQASPANRLAVLDLVWNTQVLPLLEEYFFAQPEVLLEILAPFVDDAAAYSPESFQHLRGDDLVVALSRVCDGG